MHFSKLRVQAYNHCLFHASGGKQSNKKSPSKLHITFFVTVPSCKNDWDFHLFLTQEYKNDVSKTNIKTSGVFFLQEGITPVI